MKKKLPRTWFLGRLVSRLREIFIRATHWQVQDNKLAFDIVPERTAKLTKKRARQKC